jgi:hypothetical protein
MTALLQELAEMSSTPIKQEIEQHPAWIGNVSGLNAEKLLRGHQKPYLFLLRSGETANESQTDYYISFLLPDLSIKHQPFVITITAIGWYFENICAGGPFTEASIDDVLHLMMHCHKDECTPLVQF